MFRRSTSKSPLSCFGLKLPLQLLALLLAPLTYIAIPVSNYTALVCRPIVICSTCFPLLPMIRG